MSLRYQIGVAFSLLALSSASPQQAIEASSDVSLVRAMTPELVDARLGSRDALTAEQRQNLSNDEQIGFRYEADLDSDGLTELILLGTFGESDRRLGFALIAQQEAGQWVRSELLTFDRDLVIGVGVDKNNRLQVNFCSGCDFGGWIEWTGSSYEFKLRPEPGRRDIE